MLATPAAISFWNEKIRRRQSETWSIAEQKMETVPLGASDRRFAVVIRCRLYIQTSQAVPVVYEKTFDTKNVGISTRRRFMFASYILSHCSRFDVICICGKCTLSLPLAYVNKYTFKLRLMRWYEHRVIRRNDDQTLVVGE